MIKLGFSYRRGSPLSWLIMKISRSPASHVWLLDEEGSKDDPGIPLVYEATTEGVRDLPFTRFARDNQVVMTIAPDPPIDAIMPTVRAYRGLPYDVASLVVAAFLSMLRKIKIKLRSPLHTTKALMCTELVVRGLQETSYPDSETLDPEATTPADLASFFATPHRRRA